MTRSSDNGQRCPFWLRLARVGGSERMLTRYDTPSLQPRSSTRKIMKLGLLGVERVAGFCGPLR